MRVLTDLKKIRRYESADRFKKTRGYESADRFKKTRRYFPKTNLSVRKPQKKQTENRFNLVIVNDS